MRKHLIWLWLPNSLSVEDHDTLVHAHAHMLRPVYKKDTFRLEKQKQVDQRKKF